MHMLNSDRLTREAMFGTLIGVLISNMKEGNKITQDNI